MLLPLVPSVHPSAHRAEADLDLRQEPLSAALARDRGLCRFCGLLAGSWRDVQAINDDHVNCSDGNLAASCPVCHAVQHIGDSHADEQMRVIWLPELTQNVVSVVVRGIHDALFADGLPCSLTKRPIFNHGAVSTAWRAYKALESRASGARSVLDSDRPSHLAAALTALTPSDYGRRSTLLGGLRVLHRGVVLRGGRDAYPDQLRTWADVRAARSQHQAQPLRSAECTRPS